MRHPLHDAITDVMIALGETAQPHAVRALLERLCELAVERGRRSLAYTNTNPDVTIGEVGQADGVR